MKVGSLVKVVGGTCIWWQAEYKRGTWQIIEREYAVVTLGEIGLFLGEVFFARNSVLNGQRSAVLIKDKFVAVPTQYLKLIPQ